MEVSQPPLRASVHSAGESRKDGKAGDVDVEEITISEKKGIGKGQAYPPGFYFLRGGSSAGPVLGSKKGTTTSSLTLHD